MTNSFSALGAYRHGADTVHDAITRTITTWPEDLRRSLKYECVYRHAFETGSELRVALGRWITYYNTQRPHSGLAGRTPVEVYRRIGQSDHGGMNDNRD